MVTSSVSFQNTGNGPIETVSNSLKTHVTKKRTQAHMVKP